MFGVFVNRTNVYWIGYHPARATYMYFPSLAEWGVVAGSLAALIFCWRVIATFFPVISLPGAPDLAPIAYSRRNGSRRRTDRRHWPRSPAGTRFAPGTLGIPGTLGKSEATGPG